MFCKTFTIGNCSYFWTDWKKSFKLEELIVCNCRIEESKLTMYFPHPQCLPGLKLASKLLVSTFWFWIISSELSLSDENELLWRFHMKINSWLNQIIRDVYCVLEPFTLFSFEVRTPVLMTINDTNMEILDRWIGSHF